ncbi:MAG: iron complex outermembrane receptor protein, partial [Marivirga sp.]
MIKNMLNKLSSYFIIAFLFTFSSHHAMAQSLTISGKVLGENKQPLIGANVMLTPSKQGAVTDMEGDFKINSLSSGTYTLIVSYVGYKSTSRELQITENTVADFRLQMDALLSEEVVVRAIRADALSPITQKTLTEKDIKKVFNGQDGTFVLETLTPSIQVNSDAGTRFTNYGGMRLRGIDQKRINITLNGVPLNDMMDQGVFFSNFTDITRSVQSVQVQRGVG